MKKKLFITLVMTLLAASLFSGCGKSEEQQARDEIMSHMSDNEKAAIADDQKAIADYEAEKQAQADAIANEQPINYSEVMSEKALSDITFQSAEVINIPVNVLLPGEEYLYSGKGYDIERDVARGMFNYGQNQKVVDSNFGVIQANQISGDVEMCGDYIVSCKLSDNEVGLNFLFIAENGSDYALQITFNSYTDDYYDCAKSMCEQNYEYIKTQLGN